MIVRDRQKQWCKRGKKIEDKEDNNNNSTTINRKKDYNDNNSSATVDAKREKQAHAIPTCYNNKGGKSDNAEIKLGRRRQQEQQQFSNNQPQK